MRNPRTPIGPGERYVEQIEAYVDTSLADEYFT